MAVVVVQQNTFLALDSLADVDEPQRCRSLSPCWRLSTRGEEADSDLRNEKPRSSDLWSESTEYVEDDASSAPSSWAASSSAPSELAPLPAPSAPPVRIPRKPARRRDARPGRRDAGQRRKQDGEVLAPKASDANKLPAAVARPEPSGLEPAGEPIAKMTTILTYLYRFLRALSGVLDVSIEKKITTTEFTVELHKTEAAALGVDVDFSSGALEIQAIEEGLVMDWNKQHPESLVKAGDHIVAVNGVDGSVEELVGEIKSSATLKLKIRRVETRDREVTICLAPNTIDVDFLLQGAQSALHSACMNSSNVYLVGFLTHAFEILNDGTFMATLCTVPEEDSGEVCWPSLKYGCCNHTSCYWKQFDAFEQVQVTVKIRHVVH